MWEKSTKENFPWLVSSYLRWVDKRRYIHNYKPQNNKYRRPYRKYKLTFCNRCGFIPDDPCQMDVHHVDYDHHNNDPNNLETLCANCHRLEHKKTPKILLLGVFVCQPTTHGDFEA